MADDLLKASGEDFLAQEAQYKERALRNNWVNTADVSPDAFAKKISLSKATGIPIQSLFADPGAAQRHEALQGTDFTRLVNDSPKTANFLLDPVRAGVFRENTNELTTMEKSLAALNWIGASEVSGAHALAGGMAKLLHSALLLPGLTTAEEDVSAETVKTSAAFGLVRFAKRQQAAADETMKQASPEARSLYGDLKWDTLNPREAAYLSPVAVTGAALQSLPSSLALMATALLTKGSANAAYREAILSGATKEVATKAAVDAGVAMATKAGALGEGSIGYAQNALETQRAVENMPRAQIETSPEFQKLVAAGETPDNAHHLLAAQAGELSGVGAGVVDAYTNLVGGRFLGRIIGEGGRLLPRLFKGAAAEAVQEGVQSPFEQLSGNVAKQAFANPTQDLTEGVAASTVQGLVVGGLTGGAFAGMIGEGVRDNAAVGETKARAQHIVDMFNAAAKVLPLGQDNLKAFFQTVAPNDTVFIDPAKLSEVMAESKLDLATVLPSAAEQIAAGEIAGPGIEVPIGELIAGLTGTGAEAAIIQHIRTSPDAMTLAETQADGTKTAEFFQQEADRVMAKQADSEAYAAEAKAVREDVLTQLNQAAAYRSTVNEAFATLTGHAMTVLADRIGSTPMKVWQQHHLNVTGAKGPQTNTLNIGLDIGATDRAQQVPVEDVIKAIEKFGVKVTKRSPVAATYQHEGKDVTENTLVVDTSRPLTDAEMLQLANDLGQEAIPQRTGQAGKLYGPKAADWGDFNPEFFREHDGKKMSEMFDQSQSTRRPSTKKNPENHLGEVPLTVDYRAIEPEKNAQNMALVSKYPGLRFKARDAAKRVEEFIQHMTNNLLWLHDQIPAEIRERSKLWYDGARVITERWAAKYGKTDAQIAAVLAVYSPQKDWFMNVSLAERTLDIVADQQNTAWSDEMTATADRILGKDKFDLLRAAVKGKTLGQLTDKFEQAAWIRVYDETRNNRAHRLVTPEGGFGEYAKTVKGDDTATGWPGFQTIIKALYAIEDGRPEIIDRVIGDEHKVRSFYNNISHPNSSYGFTAIDTHAVAAALLRPLSVNSREVAHAFGSGIVGEPGPAQSAVTGMKGTYAYYQEAYRRAAEARGLLPREMQSITWEAVRELYTMPFKHNKEKLNALDAIWTEFEKGKRDLESVHAEILRLAGGVENPAWVGHDSGLHEKGWASSYTGELLGDQLPRRDTGGVDAGTGKRAAALYQTQRDAAAVAGPVTGVHFSKEKRTTLLGSAFGTGAKGAERERLAVATDPRIKQRIAFYVDTGKGIHPEDGVGAAAHTATLDNLYDADADALKIFKNYAHDMNAAESAVLDAGYAGYLTREFGQQGAVVMLGKQAIPVQHVGGLKDVKVPQPPAANIPAMKALAMSIIQNRSLPAGQMSRDEWQKTLTKTNPTLAEQIDFSKLEAGKDYYKDDLAGLLWQGGHWYFSQLQAAVEKAPAKVFTSGNAVKQWLVSNAGKLGVKQMEIEATGITDWLDTQGKAPVDRAMVVEFLKGNGVKITETMLDSNDVVTDADIEDGADIKGYHVTQDDNGRWRAFDLNTDEEVIAGNNRWTIADWINEKTEGNAAPKFDDPKYRPPGGTNYRERVFTLPSREAAFTIPNGVRIRYDGEGSFGLYQDSQWLGSYPSRTEATKAMEKRFGTAKNFKSQHWDQPNVVAHMRVQDVVGADGTRNLEVIEIQSDWGQKGKKEGFQRDTIWLVFNAKGKLHHSFIDKTLADAEASKVSGHVEAGRQKGPPSAPFVTDTKSWTALVIKRAIMLAAQEGYDGVVFATGEQNADFYKLSKQLDTVLWDGDEKTGTLIARKDGANVLVEKGIDSAKLADLIGKDVAEKLLTAEKNQYGMREVSGLAMDVGGEGMLKFYGHSDPNKPVGIDEHGNPVFAIVPVVTKTVLKQIGASEVKLGQIELPKRTQPGFLLSEDLRNQLLTTGVPLFARGNTGERLGSFRPATLDMQLLANANLSTFMHELGHFFLTVYTDVASQPGAPKGITADVNALLRWFGVPDLATWNSMTTEQQTPHHEKFAESFEQYLFSGKAPNVELKTLYQRFASWMKKVYGSLKEFVASHPGAQLTPEVEAVMERMLATEQEIADANEQRNYEALFKIAVEAGMSDREFAEYMALPEAQREDAEALLRSRRLRDMKWLRNSRDKVIAELQKDSRDQRAAMLAEVKAELAATPIRKAMRWLKQGEMVDENGNEIKATEDNKLQLSDLDEVFPPGMLNRPDLSKLGVGKYGMVAKVGLHPDMVAEMFGFTSGDALVRELIAQPNFNDEVEALTDQRMLEEYGDLSSPEAIARAADEAVHNTARARMVATELAAVAENVGSPASLMKAAKEYARQLITTKTSKTLKPWAFAAAELRASKAALAALRKGDTAAVATEKRTELVNHAAVKEAYAAEAEIKAIVARFKKIMGYSDKSSAITSRDMATVQAVRAVLAQVGVAEHKGEAAAEYLDLVDQYDPVTGQTLRETIKDIGEAKDWREIKLADLRVLAENVDNLWGRAKSLREFVIGEKRMTQDEVVAEIMPVLTPHLPGEKLGTKSAVTEKEQRWLSYSGLKSVFARVELWANKIDNAPVIGPLTRYLVNTIKAAEGRYLVQRQTELTLLNERIASIAPLLKPRLIEAPELNYTFGKGSSRSGLAELIGALLHTGNASNKQKLLLGRGWATVRQDGTLDTATWDRFVKRMQDEGVLTKEVYDFVQGNWNMFERIKPDMQKAHKAVFGKFFGEITAEKFSTPFGEYAGGYVPAMTDRDIVHDLDVKELDLETLGGVSHSLPAPANGMTKERSNSYNKPLALDLTLLPMQLNKALLFAHMAQPVQQVQRLINNTAVKDALDQTFPGARKHMLMPWLARAATHRTSLQATEFGDTGNWWKRLRSNTGMARMMGNVVNVLQQYTGAITAAGVLENPRHLMYAAPALLGIGDLRAQVKGMSPYMTTRMENELSAISANIHEILVNPSVYEKADNWTRRNAYFMQQWADVHLSPVIWMAAYNSTKDAHPDIAEQDARDYADSVIRRTQGATGATDISTFESGSPFAQMFTQFFSWSLMQGQTIWGELAKNADSQRSPLAKVGRASGIILSMVLAQSIVAEAIALAFRGGPDDDDGDGQLIDDWLHQVLIMGPVKFMVGMVPVAGKAITVVINKANDKPYDDRISAAPAFSAIENAAGAPASVYKAIMEDGKPSKAVRDVSELATLFGLPAAPLARPVGYAADVMSGHVEPTSGFDFARGIMTGTASPESKR